MMGWDGESLAMPLLVNSHVISGLNTHSGMEGRISISFHSGHNIEKHRRQEQELRLISAWKTCKAITENFSFKIKQGIFLGH